MATVNPINYSSNRSGIPRISSTGVAVSSTNVQYSFNADFSFSRNYSGVLIVRLQQEIPAGTTDTLPVVLTSSAGTQAITAKGGAAVTVAGLSGAGIYLMYFDRASGILQLL